MLGVDWELSGGAYRIKHIVSGGAWDARRAIAARRARPRRQGGRLRPGGERRPARHEQGPVGRLRGPGRRDGAADGEQHGVDDRLEAGRGEVPRRAKSSCGSGSGSSSAARRSRRPPTARSAYVYVQSTGVDAQNELERQFMAQWTKDGARHRRAVQQRRPDSRSLHRAAEPADSQLLGRPRRRAPPWPPVATAGRSVMLINGWSGSGGDAFPFYFREAKLGPLVGTRTWGGLIGISGSPALVDGGGVTVPTFRMLDPNGHWFAEGHGVEPDIPGRRESGGAGEGERPAAGARDSGSAAAAGAAAGRAEAAGGGEALAQRPGLSGPSCSSA